MKKNLLIGLLAILSITTINAGKTPTTEKTVLLTFRDYVLDNKVKSVLVAMAAYDIYLHGTQGSVIGQGAEYLKNSGLQLYGNAVQVYTSTSNAATATTDTVCAATDYVKSFFV